MDSCPLPRHAPLAADVTADVCVVGAGIAGLSVAYECARLGRKVVVLEDGVIGSGETGRTTAHLVNALDDRYHELEKKHGEDGARLAAQSHTAAIERVGTIVREEQIACQYELVDGYLFVPPGQDAAVLETERAAAERAGLSVERLERTPVPELDVGPCLRFPRQAQLHPLRYLVGLAEAIERRGGVIFGGTHAAEVRGGDPGQVRTSAGRTVTAAAVVVATNTPINDRLVVHTKQAAYRTYVLAYRLRPGAVPRALFWDTGSPYHYVRVASFVDGGAGAEELLLVGGEDHRTGATDDAEERFARLDRWTHERFPVREIAYRWSGQVLEPVDSLAFLGANPADAKNVFVATGDSGNGMTHGVIAGLLLSELVAGRDHPWKDLYAPNRIRLSAAPRWARENLAEVAGGPHVEREERVADLERGQGIVVRRGTTPVAVYRDEQGALHACSAVCPHLGCAVGWNALEKTWDCPCHGSRFDANGRVLMGPANRDLPPAPAHVAHHPTGL
jgi:glycine/D-amino acid oxidase-like deaminating enzyme/nitrite reductase/ring-hydroxylating ferredoxin subunit